MNFGWIKFFNPDRNYGYILQREETDPDIWFSGVSVQPCDPAEITRNAVVAYNISTQPTRKELQATDIHVLAGQTVRSLQTGEKISGTVTYHDKGRKFGYITSSAGGSQILFRESDTVNGFPGLGEAVAFKVMCTDDSVAALEVERTP